MLAAGCRFYCRLCALSSWDHGLICGRCWRVLLAATPWSPIVCFMSLVAVFQGATTCGPCPINTFAAASGSFDCAKCSTTEVSNGLGATSCIKCPTASHAQDGFCVCDDGSSSLSVLCCCPTILFAILFAEFYAAPSQGGLVCLRCPPGAVTCVNGRVINPEDSWFVYLVVLLAHAVCA
jgi:hypothetical protein